MIVIVIVVCIVLLAASPSLVLCIGYQCGTHKASSSRVGLVLRTGLSSV